LPDLPAIAEVFPGYDVGIWQAIFAPAGTPLDVIATLREAIAAVRAMPEIADRLAATGSGEPLALSEAEFAARIRADHDKFGKIIKSIGARVE
jgi:tripartite-type tricarboxylate transporter receptor subunit TctC